MYKKKKHDPWYMHSMPHCINNMAYQYVTYLWCEKKTTKIAFLKTVLQSKNEQLCAPCQKRILKWPPGCSVTKNNFLLLHDISSYFFCQIICSMCLKCVQMDLLLWGNRVQYHCKYKNIILIISGVTLGHTASW